MEKQQYFFSPDAPVSHGYIPRNSIPGFSPQTVRHTKLFSPSPPLFKLPSISSRVPALTDSSQLIAKSRGAILGALNRPSRTKENHLPCGILKSGTQKIQRNCSCQKKPMNRNTNSLNYTVNKLKKKAEYFAYEEEEDRAEKTPSQSNENNFETDNNNKDVTEISEYLGTCQRLESILADVSIPFENGACDALNRSGEPGFA